MIDRYLIPNARRRAAHEAQGERPRLVLPSADGQRRGSGCAARGRHRAPDPRDPAPCARARGQVGMARRQPRQRCDAAACAASRTSAHRRAQTSSGCCNVPSDQRTRAGVLPRPRLGDRCAAIGARRAAMERRRHRPPDVDDPTWNRARARRTRREGHQDPRRQAHRTRRTDRSALARASRPNARTRRPCGLVVADTAFVFSNSIDATVSWYPGLGLALVSAAVPRRGSRRRPTPRSTSLRGHPTVGRRRGHQDGGRPTRPPQCLNDPERLRPLSRSGRRGRGEHHRQCHLSTSRGDVVEDALAAWR